MWRTNRNGKLKLKFFFAILKLTWKQRGLVSTGKDFAHSMGLSISFRISNPFERIFPIDPNDPDNESSKKMSNICLNENVKEFKTEKHIWIVKWK